MRYEDMKPDLSGSRTKNRLRVEVYWGLDMLLEQIRDEGNFAVVFDYLCDVEVHTADSIEFHQVKTKKSGHFSYAWLCGVPREGSGKRDSVLVTLYRLKQIKEPGKTTKLFLVANAPLHIDRLRVAPEPGAYCFTGFPDKTRKKICAALAEQLDVGIGDIDLENTTYRYEELELSERIKNEVCGRMVIAYEEVRQTDCERPTVLFKALQDLANDRACVESEFSGLDEVIAAKGITRKELERLFDLHDRRADRAVERACKWAEGLPIGSQIGLKKAISEVAQMRARTPLWEDVVTVVNTIIDEVSVSSLEITELVNLIVERCPALSAVEMRGAISLAWASVALFHCLEESN